MDDTTVWEAPEPGSASGGFEVLEDLTELTAYARVRQAALRLFAQQGVAATSIRAVATAARVSPGVVQHHFRTKEGLRDEVDRYVALLAEPEVILQNETAMRYVARGVADESPGALRIFDLLVAKIGENVPERTAIMLATRTLGEALLRASVKRHRAHPEA